MGYVLRRWLADRLSTETPSGERLVALEIADQANETTRLAYGKDLLEIVARRTGFANAKQVRKVIIKLAARGVELRVPIHRDGRPVTDKNGRPVFAHENHQTTYRIPTERECPALEDPPAGPLSGDPGGSPLAVSGDPGGNERDPAGGQEGPRPGLRGTPSGSPFSSISPQDSSSLSAPARKIMSAVGATVEETREIISIIKTENHPRNLSAYVATLAENGDLAPLLERVRSGGRADASPSTPTLPTVAERLTQQPCPHGMPGGHHPRPGSGTPACPQCRTGDTPPPAAERRAAYAARQAAPPPEPRPEADQPQVTPEERDSAIAAVRDLLGGTTTRRGAGGPARVVRPRTAPEMPPEVAAAHTTLARHGNALDLMDAARKRLGDQAHRNEVVVLAAELACAGVSSAAAGG